MAPYVRENPSFALDQGLGPDQYLCQVRPGVSCGACCGLYNVADTSKPALESILRRRTRLFDTADKTIQGLDEFASLAAASEDQSRPLDEFHHCPFLGLIGHGRETVGCLLHPAGNNGIDWRGLSFYGGMACRVYFCPSTKHLPVGYKRIIKAIAPDWHWYGLVITEYRLIKAIFSWLEDELGDKLIEELLPGKDFRRALIALLGLKIDWPFRPPRFNTCCHNVFADNHPSRPSIEASLATGLSHRSRTILEAMGSWFESQNHLQQGCRLLENRIAAVVEASGQLFSPSRQFQS